MSKVILEISANTATEVIRRSDVPYPTVMLRLGDVYIDIPEDTLRALFRKWRAEFLIGPGASRNFPDF